METSSTRSSSTSSSLSASPSCISCPSLSIWTSLRSRAQPIPGRACQDWAMVFPRLRAGTPRRRSQEAGARIVLGRRRGGGATRRVGLRLGPPRRPPPPAVPPLGLLPGLLVERLACAAVRWGHLPRGSRVAGPAHDHRGRPGAATGSGRLLRPQGRDGGRPGAGPADRARPVAGACWADWPAWSSTTPRLIPAHPRTPPRWPVGTGLRLVRLDENLGPAGARNAGLPLVHGPRRWWRSWTRTAGTDRRLARHSLLGHFDDPLVAARCPPHRRVGAPRRSSALSRYEATRSPLDRGEAAGSRAAREGPVAVRAQCRARGPHRASRRRTPTSSTWCMRGGEDVDLVWRLERGRLGRALRPVEHRRARAARRRSGRSWRRRAFYGTTAASAGPPARGRAGSGPRVRLVAGRLGSRAGPPARARTGRACRRPSPSWRTACAGSCATPSAVATHIAGGGTARAALPTLGFVDACLVAGARARAGLPPDPDGGGAGPARPRSGRMDHATGRGVDPVRAVAVHVRRRCRLRRGRLGRMRAGADAGASHPPRRLALPRLVIPGPP